MNVKKRPSAVIAEASKKDFAWTDDLGSISFKLPRTSRFLTEQIVGSNGKEKFVHYKFRRLVQVSAVATFFVRGTVFRLDRAVHVAMAEFYLVFLVAIAGLYFFGDPSDFEEKVLPAIENMSKGAQIYVPFWFGLFTSITLKRWWALRRNSIGNIADNLINVSAILAAIGARCLVDPSDFQRFTALHAQIVKLGIASMSCVVEESRRASSGGGEDPSHGLVALVSTGLLTEDEKALLEEAGSRPTTLWCWIQAVSAEAMEMMSVPAPNVNMLYQEIRVAMDGIYKVQHYIRTQLPFPYVHMIVFCVNVLALVLCITAGCRVAIAIEQGNAIMEIVIPSLSILSLPLMYQGMLQICVFLSDPFGDDIIDFPIRQYQKDCAEACKDHLSCRGFYESRWLEGTAPMPSANVTKRLPDPPKVEELAHHDGPDHENAHLHHDFAPHQIDAIVGAQTLPGGVPIGKLQERIELLEHGLSCLAAIISSLQESLTRSNTAMTQSVSSLQLQITQLSSSASTTAWTALHTPAHRAPPIVTEDCGVMASDLWF